MIDRVILWVCDQCDYCRLDHGSGVHQTTDPKDWRGPLIRHKLSCVEFVRESKAEDTPNA